MIILIVSLLLKLHYLIVYTNLYYLFIPVIEVNKLAERSLNKIRVKLCGMEEAGSAASVSGQVTRLIQQARDPVNLSLLFHGWQAYL